MKKRYIFEIAFPQNDVSVPGNSSSRKQVIDMHTTSFSIKGRWLMLCTRQPHAIVYDKIELCYQLFDVNKEKSSFSMH